jgi:tetratricopeptide (TPR) repeat protein
MKSVLALRLLLAAYAIGIGAPQAVMAHDSPEHVIEMLTARMETTGPRADLYWRRATEHRALGQLNDAADDLKKAVKLKPEFLVAYADLSRVESAQGRHRRAIATANRAIKQVQNDTERASFWMLRAEIYCETGDFEKALADCDRALEARGTAEVDWYLTRSQIQCRLGRFADAARGLKRGFELTGSAVLDVESIDAMIDAGLYADALAKIEPVLAEARWQSAWLIRRGRVRLGTGNISDAHQDLLAAVQELSSRLQSKQPDFSLLADRGLAYALLGDATLARRDFGTAKGLGGDIWTLRRLEVALASQRH